MTEAIDWLVGSDLFLGAAIHSRSIFISRKLRRLNFMVYFLEHRSSQCPSHTEYEVNLASYWTD